jgi:hypothetical protein
VANTAANTRDRAEDTIEDLVNELDLFKPQPARTPQLQSEPEGTPAPIPLPPDKPTIDNDTIRIYVTYMKYNSQTGLTYSGRSSGTGNSTRPIRPQAQAIVVARDANHHKTADGYGAAVLDVFSVGKAVNLSDRDLPAYFAIRGREQQLIDFFGGAWSDTGQPYKTGNENRAVRKNHPYGRLYHEFANQRFGELHGYTGN